MQIDVPTDFQTDITRISHKMLDVAHLILDRIDGGAAPARGGPLTPALAAALNAPWRWTNNQLALWRLCAKPGCGRARCCRGEPRACLNRHLPTVPQALRNRVRVMLRAAHRRPSHHPAAISTTPTAPEASPCLKRMRARPVSWPGKKLGSASAGIRK